MSRGLLDDEAILALHRDLVAIPSVSGSEEAVMAFAADWLRARGCGVERLERNLIARRGPSDGAALLLNTHLDTVPAGGAWTRSPEVPERAEGRVYGLGSNDAKASAAAMMATLVELEDRELEAPVVLTLVADEETGGRGSELVLPHLAGRGVAFLAGVVGEPTGLDVAISQKGMMVVELVRRGAPRHAAHPGPSNPLVDLARDLVAIDALPPGVEHPDLGRTRITPTVLRAGDAKNRVPAEARAVLDVRSVPGDPHESILARLRAAVGGEIEPRSLRLQPTATDAAEPLVRAALAVRPEARVYGSPTMSDMVFLGDLPAIKCGPGRSERSHTADEFVLESEVLEGAVFYGALVRRFFEEIRS